MLQNREGKRVPEVTFRTREDGQWKNVTTDELFEGKTVVVFSLPGAFTPTCSSTHLPRYNELAPGVLRERRRRDRLRVGQRRVRDERVGEGPGRRRTSPLIPDGNGEFTAGMGMLVDKTDLGFGKRSWRYSMLVKDGVIEKMFIEPEKEGDPFEVSDADTMLALHRPEGEGAGARSRSSRAKAARSARARRRCSTELGYEYDEVPLRTGITQPRRRRGLRRRDRAAGVHRRQAHRRPGRARSMGAQGGLTSVTHA